VNLDDLRARLDTPSGSEWVRRAAWGVLAVAFLAFVVRGGSSPADPYLATADRRPLAGFDEVAFTITDPAGVMAQWCALLADTPELRAQGLMEQDGLRGYDAMLFVYDDVQSTSGFWMRNTRIPLALAFFDGDGRFVNAQGMDPCPDEVADADCPKYPSAGPFRYAIEAPRGGLGALGIGPGSTLALPPEGTPCP
jgi:uncharacterized membrane protein (UPF0127 family)